MYIRRNSEIENERRALLRVVVKLGTPTRFMVTGAGCVAVLRFLSFRVRVFSIRSIINQHSLHVYYYY